MSVGSAIVVGDLTDVFNVIGSAFANAALDAAWLTYCTQGNTGRTVTAQHSGVVRNTKSVVATLVAKLADIPRGNAAGGLASVSRGAVDAAATVTPWNPGDVQPANLLFAIAAVL